MYTPLNWIIKLFQYNVASLVIFKSAGEACRRMSCRQPPFNQGHVFISTKHTPLPKHWPGYSSLSFVTNIQNLEFRFSSHLCQLWLIRVSSRGVSSGGVPCDKHRLTPSHWQLCRMPRLGFEARQWWDTACSQWRSLIPHGHQSKRTSGRKLTDKCNDSKNISSESPIIARPNLSAFWSEETSILFSFNI